MAQWERGFSNGSYAGNWRLNLDYIITSQEAGNNRTYVELRNYVYSTGSAYTQNGLWDGRLYINGGQVNRNTPTANVGPGWYLLNAYGTWIGHDVNGNASISIGNYCNAPVNEATYGAIGWSLPRLPLAPSINGLGADQIKPTAARLGTEIAGHGHGTSSACRIYYRRQGTSTWSVTEDQGDVGGWNYFAVSGLKPGTVYEYFARWWNNNGDTADSGVLTFKTKGLAGMVPLLTGLAR